MLLNSLEALQSTNLPSASPSDAALSRIAPNKVVTLDPPVQGDAQISQEIEKLAESKDQQPKSSESSHSDDGSKGKSMQKAHKHSSGNNSAFEQAPGEKALRPHRTAGKSKI